MFVRFLLRRIYIPCWTMSDMKNWHEKYHEMLNDQITGFNGQVF